MYRRFCGSCFAVVLCCALLLFCACPVAFAAVQVTNAPGEIVDVDGVLYYYEDGEPLAKGLFFLDGYFYYARTGGKLAVERYQITYGNGILADGTACDFDASGRLLNPPEYELPSPNPDPNPEPNPEPSVNFTLGVFLADVNTVFSKGMGMVGSVVETVVSYPILYLSIVIGLCGIGVALFNRLKQ